MSRKCHIYVDVRSEIFVIYDPFSKSHISIRQAYNRRDIRFFDDGNSSTLNQITGDRRLNNLKQNMRVAFGKSLKATSFLQDGRPGGLSIRCR